MFKYRCFTFTGYDSTLSETSRDRVSPGKLLDYITNITFGGLKCLQTKIENFPLLNQTCVFKIINFFPMAQTTNGNLNNSMAQRKTTLLTLGNEFM